MTQDEKRSDTNDEVTTPESPVGIIGRLPTKKDYDDARRSLCFVTMGPEEREQLDKLLSD